MEAIISFPSSTVGIGEFLSKQHVTDSLQVHEEFMGLYSTERIEMQFKY